MVGTFIGGKSEGWKEGSEGLPEQRRKQSLKIHMETRETDLL